MATASISGKAGVATGVTGVTEIKKWTIDVATDLPDATSFASAGWKEFVAGLQGATGTLEAVGAAVPPIDGAAVTLSLKDASSATFTVACSAFLSNVRIEGAVDGVFTYTANYTATGAVTVT